MNTPQEPRQLVFVDCENVPTFDLSVVKGKPVSVTLVFGKQQHRVDISVLRLSLQLAPQIQVIEAGASGHNALDMILSVHLGRASVLRPDAEFVVVSKDRDFDPLIEHLGAMGLNVSRVPDYFARAQPARSTVRQPRPAAPVKTAQPRPELPHNPIPVPPRTPAARPEEGGIRADKFNQLVKRLTSGSNLPRKKAGLQHQIATLFGNKLSDQELDVVLQRLVRRRIVEIGADGKVAYPKRRDSRPPVE